MSNKNNYEKVKNSKGKSVSICFIDNEAFNALIDTNDEKILLKIYHALAKSAEKTIAEQEDMRKKALRTVAKFDGKKGMSDIVERARGKADKCHDTIVALEKENAWWVSLQERIILKLGEEEEEEE